jgi:hypothetical protein
MNRIILNIWHVRLKHLRKQNVRRLTKILKRMNFIKFVVDKDFCLSCIVIKQEIESHNNLVIFDKHFLNLMWSDLVESSISNDKTRYFVTFLCDFIKRSLIYVLRVKSNTFEVFKHFSLHNVNTKTIEFDVFARIEKRNIQITSLMIIVSNTTLNEINRIKNVRAKWNRRTFEKNHYVND